MVRQPKNVIHKLIDIQNKNKWTDKEMADNLLISRPQWQVYHRKPQKAIGTISNLHTGILRNYPELTSDLIEFIKAGKGDLRLD